MRYQLTITMDSGDKVISTYPDETGPAEISEELGPFAGDGQTHVMSWTDPETGEAREVNGPIADITVEEVE